MKKLWLGFLALLSVSAMLMSCVLAEGLEIEEYGPISLEETGEPAVPEEEFVIGEEQDAPEEEFVTEEEQGADARSSYPSVFFYSDAEFQNLIVNDTVAIGESYPIRMYWFAEYNNEGYDIAIYDPSGKVVSTASKTWTNGSYTRKMTLNWNTSGCKPGRYKVVVTKKFYSYFRWNEAPTTSTLYLELQCVNHIPMTVKGYAATYTSTGLTDGAKCSICGAWITPQQTIPMLECPTRVLDKNKKNGTVTISVGEKVRLVPQFATTAGASVTGYASGKAQFATVDGDGVVIGVAEGKSKITVTTDNKKTKATITVQVVDPYKPTGISITQGKTAMLTMGQTLQLGTALEPASARATLTWKSSKPKVATVDGSGKVVPVGEGKTKITVTTQNKKKATITVQVVDPNKPLGISISQGKTVTLKVGQTVKLSAVMEPASAKSALTWTSKKPAIATVDGSGNVIAVKKGKTTVTVATYNKKKASITVVVTD